MAQFALHIDIMHLSSIGSLPTWVNSFVTEVRLYEQNDRYECKAQSGNDMAEHFAISASSQALKTWATSGSSENYHRTL